LASGLRRKLVSDELFSAEGGIMEAAERRVVLTGRTATGEPGAVSFVGVRVSWGGVWSGFLVAIGVLLLLSILGLAIGITTADLGPNGELDASGLGMGAAIWSGISLLVALFIGGWIASRVGLVFDRLAGVVEGTLVWVLATLAIVYLASTGISLVASGAFTFLSGVTGRVAAVIQNAPELNQLFSGDANQILTQLDDPQTVRTIAALTGVPRRQVEARIAKIRTRVETLQNNPAQAAAAAREGVQDLLANAGRRAERAAAAAQPYASGALWTTFIVMVLSLVAAILGSTVGANRAAARVGIEHRALAMDHPRA
jgi:hypothetical protein